MRTLNRDLVNAVLDRAGFTPSQVIVEEYSQYPGAAPAVGLKIDRADVHRIVDAAEDLFNEGITSERLPVDQLASAMGVETQEDGEDLVYFTGHRLSGEAPGEASREDDPVAGSTTESDENSEPASTEGDFGPVEAEETEAPSDGVPPFIKALFTNGVKVMGDDKPLDLKALMSSLDELGAAVTAIQDRSRSCGCGSNHYPNLNAREQRLLRLGYGYREAGRALNDHVLTEVGDEILDAFEG